MFASLFQNDKLIKRHLEIVSVKRKKLKKQKKIQGPCFQI